MKRLIILGLSLVMIVGCNGTALLEVDEGADGGVVQSLQSALQNPPGVDLLTSNGRWILRDANGDALSMLVSPDRNELAAFEEPVLSCVRVHYIDGVPVELYYGLATGIIGDCPHPKYTVYETWRDNYNAKFLDPGCSGSAYSRYSGSIGNIEIVAGGIYYIDNDDVSIPPYYYMWNDGTSECDEYDNSAGRWFMAYKSVPEQFVNALSNSPYTLGMEY